MHDDNGIRRRPDGSIDTACYCALGRRERAAQARRVLDARPRRRIARPWRWS